MECKREEHFMAFNTVSIYLTIIWITHCVFMEITPYFITVCSICYSRWFVIVQNLQNFISKHFYASTNYQIFRKIPIYRFVTESSFFLDLLSGYWGIPWCEQPISPSLWPQ